MVAVVVIVRITIKIIASVQHHIVLVPVVVVPIGIVPNPSLKPNIGSSPKPLVFVLGISATSPKM